MKKIYIVRHGETLINKYNKMQGWCDTPLTEKGVAQAKQAGKALGQVQFDLALSSDMKRAIDTCDYIIDENVNKANLQHLTSPFFREQRYGYFEGMDSEQAWQMIGGPHGYSARDQLLKHFSFSEVKDMMKEADPYHDAENASEYWARLNKGFDLIGQLDGAENILLVTHGFTIRSIVDRFTANGTYDLGHGPQNASISIMTMSDSKIKIESYNQLSL